MDPEATRSLLELWQTVTGGTLLESIALDASLGDCDLAETCSEEPGTEMALTERALRAEDGFSGLQFLGAGGMGVVYTAQQQKLRRTVALKVLKTPAGSSDSSLKTHFVQEATLTGSLEHPNIVPVYGLGQTPAGLPFMAMKLVRGKTWREKIDLGMSLEDSLEILVQVCHGVAFAHSHAIVHNDLKPANIMVGDYGEVLVLDWGIAVEVCESPRSSGFRHKSTVDRPCGTPRYMAPELALGRGEAISWATDVYLLGGILYELVARRPLRRYATVTEAIVAAALGTLPEFPQDFPQELASICRRALEPDPESRYSSVAAFLQELRAYLSHRESIHVCDEALRLLAGLPALLQAENGESAQRVFTESRFGFQLALRTWPENQAARRGLANAYLWMAEHALDRAQLETAQRLMTEMPQIRAALEGRLELALRERSADFHAIEDLFNPEVENRLRSRTVCALMVLFGLLMLPLQLLSERRGYVLALSVGGVLAVAAVGYVFRRRLRANEANARLTLAFLCLSALDLVLALSYRSFGLSAMQVQAFLSLQEGAMLLIAASCLDVHLLVPALSLLLAFVLSSLWGPSAALFRCLAFILGGASYGLSYRILPDFQLRFSQGRGFVDVTRRPAQGQAES